MLTDNVPFKCLLPLVMVVGSRNTNKTKSVESVESMKIKKQPVPQRQYDYTLVTGRGETIILVRDTDTHGVIMVLQSQCQITNKSGVNCPS